MKTQKHTLKIISALFAGVLATNTMAASSDGASGIADGSKVGFVYVGPISDHGWSYQHDKGRLAIERELGVKTSYVESVPEGADAERVIRELATSGNEIIFTTSFGYMNPTLKVAKQFPNVKFEHATGYKSADNMSTYSGRFYEGRTVLGTIAGMMTKSGIVGYVAPFPIPEVVRGIGAFTLALRKHSPEATVKVIWTNSWYDPGKEGDAAKALIDQGADMIVTHTDSPASLQVAEARGVHGFGQGSDMSAFAPKAHLTAIIDDWEGYYVERAKAAMDDTWETGDRWGGLASGMVVMAPYGDAVPADVRAEADKVREALIAGTMHSFDGPVKNQAGEMIVAEGSVMDDGALLSMDWYVEGVEGKLPN